MKVILRKEVEKLGGIGEVVDVAQGFARNFLLPRGLAYRASEANLKRVAEEKKQLVKQAVRDKESAQEKAKQLGDLSLTYVVQAMEDGQLYGSVSDTDIVAKLMEKGFNIDRKMILLEGPIKSLGVYTVDVKLHPEVVGQVKVWVVKE